MQYWVYILTNHTAISAEKKIKGKTREKKIELVRKNNPNFYDLSEKRE